MRVLFAFMTCFALTACGAQDATQAKQTADVPAAQTQPQAAPQTVAQEEPAAVVNEPKPGGALAYSPDGKINQSLPIKIGSDTFICPTLKLAEEYVANAKDFGIGDPPCELTPPSIGNNEGFVVNILAVKSTDVDEFAQMQADVYGVTKTFWAPTIELLYDSDRDRERRAFGQRRQNWIASNQIFIDGNGRIDTEAPLKVGQGTTLCSDYDGAVQALVQNQRGRGACVEASGDFPLRILDDSHVRHNRLVRVFVQSPLLSAGMWMKASELSYE